MKKDAVLQSFLEAKVSQNKLREDNGTYFSRFVLKITPSELEKLKLAYELAKYGHRKQFRDSGERYFEHVRGTSIILIDELGILDPEMNIAALLHDIIEDAFILTLSAIKVSFGERVEGFVDKLTKPKKNDPRFANDHERHTWYFDRLKDADPETKIIKLADRLYNMRTLNHCSPEKIRRKVEETKRVYYPLIRDIDQKYNRIALVLMRELEIALQKI